MGLNHRLHRFLLLIILFGIVGCSQAVSVEENELAEDFTLNRIDGKRISLSDFRDKKLVLAVFWATWCPYCVEEIPILNQMVDEYKDKVEILGIDIKENAEKVNSFSEKKGVKYTILLDTNGEIAKKYGVLGIPTNVLIDKDGKILYKGHSIEECKRIIMKIL